MKKLLALIILSLFQTTYNNDLPDAETHHCQRFAWQEICDFSYAHHGDGALNDFYNTTPFSPSEVTAGSTIFMTNQSIRKFFKDVHPKIQNPYIIVLYTGWLPSPEIFDDPKIIAFFCTDPGPLDFAHTTRYDAPYPYTPIKHKKLYRIPLGIYRAKRLFDTYQKIEDIFIKMRAIPKKNLVHMNFKRHPGNDLRHSVYENFKNKSWVKDCCLTSKPFEKYLEDMAECKFSLSPQGDMNDCYRHWEAILTGVVPIIQRTSMDEMFEELPVLIVDTWSEITEEFLNKKYDEIMSKSYNFEKLYMKYWCDKIKTVKDNFLESYYATT